MFRDKQNLIADGLSAGADTSTTVLKPVITPTVGSSATVDSGLPGLVQRGWERIRCYESSPILWLFQTKFWIWRERFSFDLIAVQMRPSVGRKSVTFARGLFYPCFWALAVLRVSCLMISFRAVHCFRELKRVPFGIWDSESGVDSSGPRLVWAPLAHRPPPRCHVCSYGLQPSRKW